jgi:hypothetical protein
MELRLTFPFAIFFSRFKSMCMTRVGACMYGMYIPRPSVTSAMSSYKDETDLTLVRVWREQNRRGRVRAGIVSRLEARLMEA